MEKNIARMASVLARCGLSCGHSFPMLFSSCCSLQWLRTSFGSPRDHLVKPCPHMAKVNLRESHYYKGNIQPSCRYMQGSLFGPCGHALSSAVMPKTVSQSVTYPACQTRGGKRQRDSCSWELSLIGTNGISCVTLQ